MVSGAMATWPALSKWQDLRGYLLPLAGHRTVPVEVSREGPMCHMTAVVCGVLVVPYCL